MADTDDYLGLITPYFRGREKFTATITALVEPFSALQTALANIPTDFDLDYAVGDQLDVVGEWVGRSRNIDTPIANLWFAFDTENKGFDYGIWKGPYDSETGITTLDDDTYRTFLRAKIAANNWDGTVESVTDAFDIIFEIETEDSTLEGATDDGSYVTLIGQNDSGSYSNLTGTERTDNGSHLFIVDNGDMTMTLGVSGSIPSILFLALLEQNWLPIKPEGVLMDFEITSVENTPVFGFDVDNQYIGGFDTGSWGVAPSYFTS